MLPAALLTLLFTASPGSPYKDPSAGGSAHSGCHRAVPVIAEEDNKKAIKT